MSRMYCCNNVIKFEAPGFARQKHCEHCGAKVAPETYYQKTSLCQATVCAKCGKSRYPERYCTCSN